MIPYYSMWMVFGFLLVVLWAVMQWHDKMPTIESLQKLAAVLNSRGGNILVLAIFTLIFFFTGMRFFYYCITQVAKGAISPDNAVMLQAIQWITGAAFGMTLSPMLKAMTGENSGGRATDGRPPKTDDQK